MGSPILIVPASFYINNAVLAADTAENIAIPTDAVWVLLGANADFWARFDGSAAVIPTADVTDGTGSVLNPTARHIGNVTGGNISVISAVAAKISAEFYK